MLNCKDYEKMIPDFLADKLDAKTAEKFIGHIEKCPECMEEVSIQYLITEGMNRLEEGNTFELQKELGKLIEENKDWMYMQKCLKLVHFGTASIGVCAIVAVLLMVIFL